MDDDKPVIEQMTDAVAAAATTTTEAAKTVVKKVRKAAKKVARKVSPAKKKKEESQEGWKESWQEVGEEGQEGSEEIRQEEKEGQEVEALTRSIGRPGLGRNCAPAPGIHTARSLNRPRWQIPSAKPLPGVMGPGSALAFARLCGTTAVFVSTSISNSQPGRYASAFSRRVSPEV